MDIIKIKITNTEQYEKGVDISEWIKLPTTETALTEAELNIGVTGTEGSYFISDYVAPFKIDPLESIDLLNEKAESELI